MSKPSAQFEPGPDPDPSRELRRQFVRHWSAAETRVGAFVFATVPGFHDAEDLLQQIAEEAAVRFDEFDPARGPFEAWVIFWAKRRIIDHFRRARRDRHVFDESLIDAIAEAQVARRGVDDPRAEALERCLGELPDKSRRLLNLRYVEDRTPAQIAEAVGSTPGSVRVTLCRVRDILAECIRKRVSKEGA